MVRRENSKSEKRGHLMEWYFTEICKGNPYGASIFGAIQLILLAGIWLFKLGFPKPVKKDQ
jgi:hypothetical protein